MKNLKALTLLMLVFNSFFVFAQPKPELQKYKVEGKIVEKTSSIPLEYATVTFVNVNNPKAIFGGITNAKGEFNVEVNQGIYNIKIEFISFKPKEIKQKSIKSSTNLGLITLEEDATLLSEVVVRSEKTTLEIKLDKKVYNVGNDLMVKGGTVSDVLDNIPSVSVDVEGKVSLRGNDNVKILIDGRPSNAINIADALRLIPADAIEKVEVITNPSARYDAEGGGGLLNIILKKGKNQGVNGTVIASGGYPESYGLSTSVNYKTKNFNLFTTQGYNNRNNPGNAKTDSEYLFPSGATKNYIFERRKNERLSKGYNGTFGFEWNLDKTTSWTNSVNYRRNSGDNRDNVFQDNYNSNFVYDYTRNRINEEDSESENIEYTTNFTKKFKKDGHKLNIDGSFSSNSDNDIALITDSATNTSIIKFDNTFKDQRQRRNLFQVDYVLPLGKGSQFEAGYRGDFIDNTTAYEVINNGVPDPNFTNTLEYKEKVNALYTQYGFKANKLSTLFGLRFEDSNIDVNQLVTNDFNNKKYNNFFPSAFFTYELSKESNASVSYSRRINRPRGRQLNPFSNLSSNINIFMGNPDLNPSLTHALDFGYIKRWSKLTLNTSMYANKTSDAFQFVRKESGTFVNGAPVIISTPINLATEYRTGFEFTLNYSPYKWWKLNSNFNFFRVETQGLYQYVDFNGNNVSQDFGNIANAWSTRLTSKVTLPYKIDWQTNATYQGPQTNAQGRSLGVFSGNLAFSKDVLKEKGTLSFNINDVLNSRKRIWETNIPGVVNSESEWQWRERQFTLSFTYRFNRQKNEKEKKPRSLQQEGEGGDFPG